MMSLEAMRRSDHYTSVNDWSALDTLRSSVPFLSRLGVSAVGTKVPAGSLCEPVRWGEPSDRLSPHGKRPGDVSSSTSGRGSNSCSGSRHIFLEGGGGSDP